MDKNNIHIDENIDNNVSNDRLNEATSTAGAQIDDEVASRAECAENGGECAQNVQDGVECAEDCDNIEQTERSQGAEDVADVQEGVDGKESKAKKFGKAFVKELPKIGIIILSALLYATGIELFVSDNGFVTGGAWGIALMIEHVFGVPSGYMILALNIPLLILAVIFLGWKFAAYTFLFVGTQSLFSSLVGLIGIQKPILTGDSQQLLSAIVAGAIMGVGLAMCLRFGGCTGGTDIISVILQKKKLPISVPWIIFTINAIIISASYFVYGGLEAIVFSLILEFVASKVSDAILSGFTGAVRFEIVTAKGEELRDAIIHRMDKGATVISAKGGFTLEDRSVIVCIVHKRHTADFKKFLKSIDPDAFINIAKVSSVMGKGFKGDND